MTREEAIADIRDNIKPVVGGISLDIAIKALEQQLCEDCISRQAVLDIIMPYCQDDDGSVENTGDLRNALDDIESLPTVTPKEKTGHWTRVTDKTGHLVWECGCRWQQRIATNFCPDCGCHMVAPQESEVSE